MLDSHNNYVDVHISIDIRLNLQIKNCLKVYEILGDSS